MKSLVTLTENGNYWKAAWRTGPGAAGRHFRSLGPIRGGLSRKQALEACQAIAAETFERSGKAPTLSGWREDYFALRTDLGDKTIALHQATFARLEAHFGAGVGIDTIDRLGAARFRAEIAKTMEEATVARHIRTCKVIFGAAADLDLIETNPFDRQSGAAPEVARDWADCSDANLVRIMEHCPNDQWRACFALARWAGLRRGEALRTAWSDWDVATGILSVRHVGRHTTKKRPRSVPVRPDLARLLAEWHGRAAPGSIGPCDGLDDDAIDDLAWGILEKAGRELGGCPLHDLRRNCISYWMAERWPVTDVAAWSGHSVAVLEKHYARMTGATLAAVTGITQSSPSPSST